MRGPLGQKTWSTNVLMNSESPISENGIWNDANVAPLSVTSKKIDSPNRESQYQTFRWSAGGGIHDGVSRESLIESVNGVEEISCRVRMAPS